MEPERFRTYFVTRLFRPLALVAPLLLLRLSPAGRAWPLEVWLAMAAVAAALYASYILTVVKHSSVVLDDRGITLRIRSAPETLPYDRVLKLKQIGRYRVRLCVSTDDPDVHRHVSIDLWNSDAFVDAVIDWVCETTGRELTHPLALEEAA